MADGAGAESVGEVGRDGLVPATLKARLLPTQAMDAQVEADRLMKWVRGCNSVAMGSRSADGSRRGRLRWIVRVGRVFGR